MTRIKNIIFGCFVTLLAATIAITALYKPQFIDRYEETIGSADTDVRECNGRYAYAIAKTRTFGITKDGTPIDFEAHAGVKVSIVNNQLHLRFYTHAGDSIRPFGEVAIQPFTMDLPKTVLNTYIFDKEYIIDTSSLESKNLYKIKYSIAVGDNTAEERAYFVKDENGELFTCRVSNIIEPIDEFNEFMKDTKPEDNLDISKLSWPSEYHETYNAADDLCKLADEIIKDKNWSNELKIYAVVDYMRRNFAFDQWYEKQGRGNHYGRSDWDDPSGFAPTTHVGVCADFANMLVIMYRHLGIPACGIDDDTGDGGKHMWMAVWVSDVDGWGTIDMNNLVLWDCKYEDPDRDEWAAKRTVSLWDGNYLGQYEGQGINTYHLRTYKD